MVCPNCQATISDQAKFCSVCGQPISAPAPASAPQWGYMPQPAMYDPYQQQRQAVRQSEMQMLSGVIAHFSKKQERYDAYDAVCEQVKRFSRGAKSALIVWGAIIATFGLILVLAASSSGDDDVVVPMACFSLIPGIAMIVGGILMKVNSGRKLTQYLQEYVNIAEELYTHYFAFPNCPVGLEYSNPQTLQAVLSMLQSGRADTIKEALQVAVANANQRAIHGYQTDMQKNTAAVVAQMRVATCILPARFFR